MDGGTSLEGTARERAARLGLAFGVDRPVDVEPALEQLLGATLVEAFGIGMGAE